MGRFSRRFEGKITASLAIPVPAKIVDVNSVQSRMRRRAADMFWGHERAWREAGDHHDSAVGGGRGGLTSGGGGGRQRRLPVLQRPVLIRSCAEACAIIEAYMLIGCPLNPRRNCSLDAAIVLGNAGAVRLHGGYLEDVFVDFCAELPSFMALTSFYNMCARVQARLEQGTIPQRASLDILEVEESHWYRNQKSRAEGMHKVHIDWLIRKEEQVRRHQAEQRKAKRQRQDRERNGPIVIDAKPKAKITDFFKMLPQRLDGHSPHYDS